MTVRELYRSVLIELNKEEASSLYVEDFLYFANKAINYYVNMRYNLYDTSQQLSDDLRVLRKGPEEIKILTAEEVEVCIANCVDDDAECIKDCGNNLRTLKYPYRHLLNCIVTTKLNKHSFVCEQEINTEIEYAAKRLTADRKAAILGNTYLAPKFYRPYYDIIGHNINIKVGDNSDDEFSITKITIEYIKDPEELVLSPDDLLVTEDNSATMEFPEYVCVEIINAVTVLVMEQGSNPRLSTNPQINQSVGPFGGEK